MLRTQFEKNKLNDDQLIFKEVEWSSILSTNEGKLFHNIKENLSFLGLRKFIIHSFGDAIAYQKTGSPHDTYNLINDLIKTKYDELIAEGVDEIYFVAHSLGGVILSNFIYDSQTSGVDIQFKKLFTFGTTIPLWTLKYKNFDNPIHLNDYQTWINMYDNDDILGYPLGNISPKYQDLVKAGKLIDMVGKTIVDPYIRLNPHLVEPTMPLGLLDRQRCNQNYCGGSEMKYHHHTIFSPYFSLFFIKFASGNINN